MLRATESSPSAHQMRLILSREDQVATLSEWAADLRLRIADFRLGTDSDSDVHLHQRRLFGQLPVDRA